MTPEEKREDYLRRIAEVRNRPCKRTEKEAYAQMDRMLKRTSTGIKGSGMKVKIGNIIYDTNDQPIMVILAEEDKKNIANMYDECYKYCGYPASGYSVEEIEKFMETPENPKNE